jgi:oligopeptidase B
VQEPRAPQRPHTWQRPTGPVDDPWAWLRDRDDPATIGYLEQENAYADAWFSGHAGLVDELFDELRSRVQETDLSAPVRKGEWWYVGRTEEGSSYPIHCRGASAATATEHVILDENAEAEDGDYFSMAAFEVSPNHRLLAWSSDRDGSERYTLRVRDLDAGRELADELHDTTWGGVAWGADNASLLYVKPDEQMRPFQVWRHVLGTAQDDDRLVYEDPDERFFVGVGSTRSGEWIVIECESKLSGEARLIPAGDTNDGADAFVRHLR